MLVKMLKTPTVFGFLLRLDFDKSTESVSSPGPISPKIRERMLKYFVKNSFEFTIIISAFLCLTHSPDLRAEGSPAAVSKVDAIAFAPSQIWLSQLKTQLENVKLDLDQQVDNLGYALPDGSVRFVSERVNMSTRFQSKVIASNFDNSAVQLSLRLDFAKVLANNFNLEAIIQKDLGFGSATLKLDMHCDAVELNLKNSNPVSAEVKIEHGQFSVNQLAWDLRSSQIETKLVGCKEVAGFDQLLKEQIQQYIEKSLVIDSLQQLVNQKMNALVHQKIAAMLAEIVKKLKVAEGQKYQFDDKNNLWIFSGSNLEQIFTPEEMTRIKASQKPALLIKKQNLEAFAKDAINDLLKNNTLSSKSIEGMNRLTCSRFIQTFVWPSLKSLSKCFEMKIQNQVQSLNITDLANLGFDIKVGSWASGEGHQIAYFESSLRARVMRSEVEMKDFKGQSNPDFVRWSGRSKRISTSMIQPSLEDLIQWSIGQLKDNAILKLIQKNTKLNLVGADTLLVEVSL